MRLILAAAVALTATAAHADTMKNCATAWKAKAPDAVASKTYKAWSATCLKKGYTVTASASAMAVPAGATAKCKDNAYSMA